MNQIVLVPVVILSSILLLSAPIAVHTADTCADGTNTTTCCAIAGCGWFECNRDNKNVTVCLNKTDTTDIGTACSGSTDPADKTSKCPVAPPTPATCEGLNSTTCCVGGDDKLTVCGWYTCGTEQSCWNSSDTAGFKADCDTKGSTTDLKNACEKPTDSCSSSPNDTICCATSSCGWYKCKDTDGKLTGDGVCASNTTDTPVSCTSPSTPLDTCQEGPTPAPVETCASYNTSKDTCCNTTGITCQWINCTGVAFDCMDITASTDACKVKENVCTATTPSPITTPAATTPAPSTAGPTTGAPAPASNTGMQHFDGASFVGGIILAVGVIAIAFFGCKFYKARKERNYHTL